MKNGWEITLLNFRKHKSKKINLPLKGLVLLHGRNGTGKSTILKAIYWCLYGGGNKTLMSHGETKTEVSIVYTSDNQKVTIKRSRPPNRIIYKDSTSSYEGDEAQSLINEFIGANSTVFNVGCYMRQRHKFNSIIAASSSDQVSVIEELVDRGIGETIKEKVKNRIKIISSSLQAIKDKLILFESTLNTLSSEKVEEPETIVDQSTIEKLTRKRECILEELEILKQKQDNNKDLVASYEAKKMLRANLSEEMREISIKTIKESLVKLEFEYKEALDFELYSKLKEKLDVLKKSRILKRKNLEQEFDFEEFNSLDLKLKGLEKKILESKFEPTGIKDDINHLLSKMTEKYPELLSNDEGPEEARGIPDFFETKFSSKNQIAQCPCCKAKLSVNEDFSITKYVKSDKILVGAKKYLDMKEDVYLLKDLFEKMDEESKRMDSYQKLIKEKKRVFDAWSPLNSIKLKIETLKEPSIEEKLIESQIKSLSTKKVETKSSEIKKSIIDLEAKKNRYFYIRKILDEPLEDIECEDYSDDIENLEEKIKNINQKISESTLQFMDSERWRKYQENLQKKGDITEKMEIYKKKQKIYEENLALHEKLLQKTSEASVKSITYLIDQINSISRNHIKNLFDESVEVELYNEKLDKIKLGVKMTIDGIPIEDYDDQVGGGQQQRVEFAYCFALNEITGTDKILAFDESFGAADPEAYLQCLNYMKKSMNNRLIVMISHHLIEGVFDQVISLDE